MRDGPKKLNLGLTIISMMVMVVAGVSIMKIPNVSADWEDFTFYVIPEDENNNVIPNCEAMVINVDNEEEYVVFQESNGEIAINTNQFGWDTTIYHSIRIVVYDNLETYYCADIMAHLDSSYEEEILTACCYLKADTSTIKTFCNGMALNNVPHGTTTGIHLDTQMTSITSVNVLPLTAQGNLIFKCGYRADFSAQKTPFANNGYYTWNIWFQFTIAHCYTLNGVKQIISSPEDTAAEMSPNYIDNTQGNGQSSIFDPTFSVTVPAHTYISGYYYLKVEASWQVYSNIWNEETQQMTQVEIVDESDYDDHYISISYS